MASRTTFASLLVLFAGSVAAASCGGEDTISKPPPRTTTSTGVTTGIYVTTVTTGAGGAGGMGGMGSAGGAGGGGGTGGAASCKESSECPGTPTSCQTPFCQAGVCDFYYSPNGSEVAMQTAGDCKSVVCDGAGAMMTLDADDPTADSNPCTDDVCVAGKTTHPASAPGTLCGSPGSGKVCDGKGACI